MKIAPLPPDEGERLKILNDYKVLDTLPERDFDDLTEIAAHICSTPIALISLIDPERQWFKSKVGLDAPETPRDIAFCAHAILQDEVFQIPDSFKDPRFHDNPLAVGAPNVRFYAGAPLHTPSGHKIGTLCVIDCHPRTLDPSQLAALEALARQVVSQLELRSSKERAEIAVQAKSSFLATMSHEIRTPMNGVLSCANLLAENLTQPEEVQLIKTIQSCGDSLLNIINGILDFSKIEAGKVRLENQPFVIEESIKEIIELLHGKSKESNLSLSYSLDENVPQSVMGDVTRFRQILTNLIGNAIKFTRSTVEVKGEVSQIKGKDYELRFSIKDDGMGIPKKAQNQLFQDFNQVDTSATRKFGGTGLGLAICKGLTTAMGGEIWVESQLGQGSTFNFTILVRGSVKSSTAEKKGKVEKFNSRMAKEHPLKILMAEDNTINQMVAKKILAKLGYTIDIAANGLEAIQALDGKKYDVILMDQHMPQMDGIQATEAIIKKWGDSRPKIFALTANVMKEDKERCLQAGMDDFLTKPIKVDELVNALLSVEANEKSAAGTQRVIDIDGLYARFDGATEVIPEIAKEFLNELPQYLKELNESIHVMDAKKLALAAHTLKGALSNFKADAAVELAFKIELAARRENLEGVDIKFEALKDLLACVKIQLESLLISESA